MKKTISGRTVNRIMHAMWVLSIVGRVMYFALLLCGTWLFIAGRQGNACAVLEAAAVSGGILGPGLAGAYKGMSKNLDKQAAEIKNSRMS
jgi:hypothetical protein